MTDIAKVDPKVRNKWRHVLLAISSHAASVRQAVGVLGALEPKGSVEGLLEDLDSMSRGISQLQAEVLREVTVQREWGHS